MAENIEEQKPKRRGRPPRAEKKKNYFGEEEEKAVVAYNNAKTAQEKIRIYNKFLKQPFKTMVESIIRRWSYYQKDEEYQETFDDALSNMITKISNFRPVITGYFEIEASSLKNYKSQNFTYMPNSIYKKKQKNANDEDPDFIIVDFKLIKKKKDDENETESQDAPQEESPKKKYRYFKKETRHYKAYSYCGTVIKRYLIQKGIQFQKRTEKNMPYDNVADNVENNIKYTEEKDPFAKTPSDVINELVRVVRIVLDSDKKENLTPNEIKVGYALCELFEHWEEILPIDDDGSNKLTKQSVLYFLREETQLDTPDVRDSMKCFKNLYYEIKDEMLN